MNVFDYATFLDNFKNNLITFIAVCIVISVILVLLGSIRFHN